MKNNLEYCKWLLIFMLMLVWSMFMFMISAKADSLNISDFESEMFLNPKPFADRLCSESLTYNTGSPSSQLYTNCTLEFSESEWNNNFKKSDYNFLIYPINHSAGIYNENQDYSRFNYLVDYTLKFYLTDINNKQYICDIVNNQIAMCRYDRDVRIKNIITQMVFTGAMPNSYGTTLGINIYYQNQYYLATYQSVSNAITDINDTLNDSSIDTSSMGSSSSDWANKNTSNSTITSLLTLPISFLQRIVNGFNGSCRSINLGNLFGTDLVLPCINIGNMLGSTLWTTIDVLFSGLMVFAIGKKLVRIFNDFTNLKDNQINDIYGGGA